MILGLVDRRLLERILTMPADKLARLLLVPLVAIGLFCRYQLIIQSGGLEPDFVAWGMTNYFGGITSGYLNAARMLADTGQYTLYGYPPGYPAFLALLMKLGLDTPLALRSAQAVLDTAGIIIMFWLVKRTAGSLAGALAAALCYSVLPVWLFGSVTLLAESLSPLLFLTLLALMWRYREAPSAGKCAALGGYAAALALIRPDLMLLIGPILLWALGHAKAAWKQHVAGALVGFALVLVPWGLTNYSKNGTFRVTGAAGFYNLWSGLGQIPNAHGYYVSDARAIEELKTLGIAWHSEAMEQHFRAKYLQAWKDHPDHVLRSIVFRFSSIPFYDATWTYSASRLKGRQMIYGFLLLLCVGTWLVISRQFAPAYIMFGPLMFALGSLGFVYVEPRYVRYVPLSYAIALGGAVGIIFQLLRQLPTPRPAQIAGAAAITAGFVGAQTEALSHWRAATDARSTMTLNAALASAAPSDWQQIGVRLDWTKAVPGVAYTFTNRGLSVTTDMSKYHYQLMHRLPIKDDKPFVVELEIDVESPDSIAAGILQADGSVFLAQASVSGPGPKRVRLTVPRARQPDPWIVLMNSNDDSRSVKFVATELNLWRQRKP